MTRMKNKRKYFHLGTAQIIVIGFLAVILAGAFLLTLPVSSNSGQPTPASDALFTAVSATCVTGLITVDTAVHWSVFGQVVILAMIQTGGLGFMTIAVLLTTALKRRLSQKERMLLAESLSLSSFNGLQRLVGRIVLGTLCIELAGAALLSIRFIPIFGVGDGIYKSVFHAVSAFCNAGFDVLGTYSGAFSNMSAFASDPLVSITLMALIIIGGIGFVVWDDIRDLIFRRRRLSVYTKFILILSASLILAGAVSIGAIEWNNPDSFGTLDFGGKILSSFFASVTARTAGFATVDFARMTEPSQFIMMALMFVGGCAGSTAGGVKVATFGVVLMTVLSTARGRDEVNVFRRRIPRTAIKRAFSVIVIQLIVTLASAIIISARGDIPMTASLFESFSASGTVGLSLSLTPSLDIINMFIVMLLMFFGRVGILTVTYALTLKNSGEGSLIKYADVHFPI